MKIVRVDYTVTAPGEDGKPVLVSKDRILSELDSTDPEYVRQILEQQIQATEEQQFGNTSTDFSLVVTNITELQPTGDDDQM